MESKVFSFNVFNDYTEDGISVATKRFLKRDFPVIVCVGSDLVLGDSLGPLVGTLLKKKGIGTYVYGTLSYPVTAKEVKYIRDYVAKTHPNKKIVAIDAAVGKMEDVGTIRVISGGLKPGLGVNKDLDMIGNISIVGVVAEKTKDNYNLFNLTRLNLIYRMAEKIANGIAKFVEGEKTQKIYGA